MATHLLRHALGDLYGGLLRTALYPVYETRLRGRRTLTRLADLEHSQWAPERQHVEENFRKMKEVLVFAETWIPFYRRKFAEHGVSARRVQDPSDLKDFPVLTKADLRHHGAELVAENWKGELFRSGTGGSTGEPARFYYDHETYECRIAAAMRADRWAGARLGDREYHLWGVQLMSQSLQKKLKNLVYQAALRRKFVSSFELSEGRLDEVLEDLAAYAPAVVIGYTNPLYFLAKHALEKGFALPAPRGIVATAERLSAPQRETIEKAFGARVFDRYGCREVMLIASECERHEGKHLNMENVFVELWSGGRLARPGEPGEVLVTDLVNRSMPLIRYQNQDVAVASSERCSCGRGLPLLASVEGRVLDMIRGPEGQLLAGEFFPHLFKDFPEVAKFQVHQARDLAITVKLVPGTGFSPDVAHMVEAKLRRFLGERAKIQVDVVLDIPLTKGGKHRVAISEATPESATEAGAAAPEGPTSAQAAA